MTTATTAAATTATTRRCSLISDAYKKCRLHAQEPCSQIAFADGRNPFPEKEKSFACEMLCQRLLCG